MTLGVLGGTFDPIHNGHIAAGLRAQQALGLAHVLVVPSHIPPHRSAGASAADRLAMASLAAAEHEGWTASDIELKRDGPSYTFDTLTALREGSTQQFFFIIGADAFAEIATWSRYPAVLDLAHFAVVARPGITLDSLQKRLPNLAERMTTPDLFTPHLRQGFGGQAGHTPAIILIQAETPDVSSTTIRRRVRTGETISELVPVSVASYISTHHLYVEATL
jgi:nicotinate-nucleotide adenylyltransferase